MYTELYHHGIKGQKWGVRRFQNEDGSLTKKGRKRYSVDQSGHISTPKGASNYWKDAQNEYFNSRGRYEDEYDKTSEGKEKLKRYQKAILDMERSMDDDYDYTNFNKAEEDYLRSQARYAGERIVSDYGEERASILASRDHPNLIKGRSAVQMIEDEWWVHAY